MRWLGLVIGCSISFGAGAQAPPEPKYGYEVASIKKSDPAAHGIRIGPGAQGGLRTQNTNLMTLLTFAYDVRQYQILEAPGWANNEGFDVSFTPDKPEALPQPGAGVAAMETMMERQRQRMQAILRDRFGLTLRMETRELPIYALTVDKNGSKLQKPAEEGKGPSMQTSPDKGVLTGVGVNMRMLTNIFSNIMGRPVVDQTGLEGTFDLQLKWKPDSFGGGPDGPRPAESTAAADADGASIFTAMREQLGLRLDAKKGPVTVYVVEKAERPSEN